jgi:predicted Na+-dependent transporter
MLWGKKLKRYVIPITGFLLIIGYMISNVGNISSEYVASLLQSFIITISLQDIFIVLFGYLISVLTFNHIKFDHKERSIMYIITTKKHDKIKLSENKMDIENDSKSLD